MNIWALRLIVTKKTDIRFAREINVCKQKVFCFLDGKTSNDSSALGRKEGSVRTDCNPGWVSVSPDTPYCSSK